MERYSLYWGNTADSDGKIVKCVIATQDPNGNHIIAEMPKLKWRRFVRWVKSFLPNSDQPKKD